MKIVLGRDYETNKSNEKKKNHIEEAKNAGEGSHSSIKDDELDEEEAVPFSLVTHANNILHPILSNGEVHISYQQFYHSNGPYAHKSYVLTNFKGVFYEKKGVLDSDGYNYEEIPDEIMEAFCLKPFHEDFENP